MNIALIQTNPIIGDFAANAATIVAYAKEAAKRDCRLAVFPEMALSGYPPQDLLDRPAFLADHQQALQTLLSELPSEMFTLIGCFEANTEANGQAKRLFNSAVTAHDHRIVHRAHKRLLPTYDVFDETRYFEPGAPSRPLVIDGEAFGVTICEDIWFDETRQYAHDPVADIFAQAGREHITLTACINLSASPFERGKEAVRRRVVSRLARRFHTPFLYCNQVGGQDSLIFDGRAMAFDGAGELRAVAHAFAEDMIIVDSANAWGDTRGSARCDEVEDVLAALVLGLHDYVKKCGFKQVALGLSGGIDSALTAAIACLALGPENVLGVAMPSRYNAEESLADARALAENLGCDFQVLPISPLVEAFQTSLAPLFHGLPEDLTEQNAQARIRGNLLMAISNKFGRLLLTTGNKSEMAVGYCTLYGDMSGGLAVIADCPKGLVYQLSELINRERIIIPRRIIEKAPSAELKPDQRDQDDLPPYPVLDAILERYLEESQSEADIVAAGFDPAVTSDILRRIRLNEYKRKQAPITLKVTGKAFGSGRRYPICQNYRG
ncbi:MAG: NAD+ synthase [Desulfobulbaceae bacterium]|jgi:NAD+ synthetase|nr:NAD+ synthase [Desulfobulbaceae bacterium]